MTHIVLLGDSIFDNSRYTEGGPDVISQVRRIVVALCAMQNSFHLFAPDGIHGYQLDNRRSGSPSLFSTYEMACVAMLPAGNGIGTESYRCTVKSVPGCSKPAFLLRLGLGRGIVFTVRNDDLGTMNAIRGTLVIKKITRHIRWLPSFFVALAKNAPEQASETPDSVRVQIWSPDRRPPLEMRIIQYHNGQIVAEEKLGKTLELNEKMDIELFFVRPDTIVLNLGSAGIRKVKVSWKPMSAVVIGSSGQMKVDPLDLGTVNP